METGKPTHVRKSRPFVKGDREAAYFAALIDKSVAVEDQEGKQFGGKLLWVGPYSLIIERHGNEVLYWKHALKSIRAANGRGDE